MKQILGFSNRKFPSRGSDFPSNGSKKARAARKPNGAVEGKSGLTVREYGRLVQHFKNTPPLAASWS